jgi:hypothetical protein
MKWDDWVDYWSVDFDFENKQEIITIDWMLIKCLCFISFNWLKIYFFHWCFKILIIGFNYLNIFFLLTF